MKNKLIIISIIFLLFSCNKSFYSISQLPKLNKLSIQDFDLFVFQMVQQKSNIHQDSLALKFQSAVDIEVDSSDLIYEELYLFLEKKGNRAIYITTLSHKYLKKSGVFNSPFFEKYIPIDQVEYLYLGHYDANKINFYDPNGRSYAQNIEFFYQLDKEVLEITKVTNNYAIESDRKDNRYVDVNEVFGINFKFEKTERRLVYQSIDLNNKATRNIIYINNIHENGKDVYFEMETDKVKKYQLFKDRVRFIYPKN